MIDHAKAFKEMCDLLDKTEEDRDFWKSKAEKLAEALKKTVSFKLLQGKLETLRLEAKEALAEFYRD